MDQVGPLHPVTSPNISTCESPSTIPAMPSEFTDGRSHVRRATRPCPRGKPIASVCRQASQSDSLCTRLNAENSHRAVLGPFPYRPRMAFPVAGTECTMRSIPLPALPTGPDVPGRVSTLFASSFSCSRSSSPGTRCCAASLSVTAATVGRPHSARSSRRGIGWHPKNQHHSTPTGTGSSGCRKHG